MNFTIPHSSMICASADAESRKYKKVLCKRGIWLIAIQPNAADNVYFHDPRDKHSQGFAGRTIMFPLEDGTVYAAKGPWHGNADSLFQDTGIDIRNQHLTFVVLSKAMKYTGAPKYNSIMIDVVYKDKKPIIGVFERDKELAKLHPEAKFSYSASQGGSSYGPIRREAI